MNDIIIHSDCCSPREFKQMDYTLISRRFLMDNPYFSRSNSIVYPIMDRLIVGGALDRKPLPSTIDPLKAAYFLEGESLVNHATLVRQERSTPMGLL